MTMLAAEAGSVASGAAGESAAKTIGQRAAKSRAKSAAAGSVGNRRQVSRAEPSKTVAARRPSTSRSVSIGKSHVKTYHGSQGRRETNVRMKGIKPPAILSGGGGKVSTLIVEWLIGVVLIIWGLFDGTKKNSFQSSAHEFFWRFFGWSAIFFVLALMMRGKNTGKFAVMFGGLLDVAIVISAYNNGSFTALANLVSGAPTIAAGGGSTPGANNANPSGGTPPSSANPLGPNAPQNQPQSPSNPSGIPNPVRNPGGFLHNLLFNPPGFLKFFDPFAWHFF